MSGLPLCGTHHLIPIGLRSNSGAVLRIKLSAMMTETQFAIFNKFRLGILCKDGLHADGGSCDCSTHVPALASPTDNGARAVQTQQASLTETNASGAENTSRSRWPPCEHNRQSGAPTSSIALWHGGQWR